MMTRGELLAASREPNVRAFLDAIAVCEGTAGLDGYRTQFGGGTFASLADHPRTVITATLGGKPIHSSAAGRYQFLRRTWDELVRQHGFPSFEPDWQDAAAVALIDGRRALAAVRAGDLARAVDLCKEEWASLPGSPHGQPTKHFSLVRDVYLRAGGRLDGGAPIEARTQPPVIGLRPEPPPAADTAPSAPSQASTAALTRPVTTEPQMAPFLAAALPALLQLIPELTKLFGSGSEVSNRNGKLIERVGEIVVQATGAPNLQGAVESMQTNADALETARDAVRREWFDLQEKSIAAARDFNMRYAQIKDVRTIPFTGLTFLELLSAWLVVSGTVAGGYVLVEGEGKFGNQMIGAVITLLVIGGAVSVREYWLGTSAESRRKTDMLNARRGDEQ